MTYASPISLDPRHYALGLYRGTLSHCNMMATRGGVLQVGVGVVLRCDRGGGGSVWGGPP